MSVTHHDFPRSIALGRNGVPKGHYAGRDAAAARLREFLHNLPGMPYMTESEAEEIADEMLTSYLRRAEAEK